MADAVGVGSTVGVGTGAGVGAGAGDGTGAAVGVFAVAFVVAVVGGRAPSFGGAAFVASGTALAIGLVTVWIDGGAAVDAALTALDAAGALADAGVESAVLAALRVPITANAPPPIASSAPRSTTGRTQRRDPAGASPGMSTGSSARWVPSCSPVERLVTAGAANGGEIAVGPEPVIGCAARSSGGVASGEASVVGTGFAFRCGASMRGVIGWVVGTALAAIAVAVSS